MSSKIWLLNSVIVLCFISGCSAAGVLLSFDPAVKLRQAEYLFGTANRPLPAEPLIFDAMDIYKKRGDEVGLAHAYREYALFLNSKAVVNWGGGYNGHGFMDKTVTFDNRYEKAIEYFQNAAELFEKHDAFDKLSNVYFNLGVQYFLFFKNKQESCKYFDMSLQAHLRFKEKNPDASVDLLEGFNSFEEIIAKAKEEIGCNSKNS